MREYAGRESTAALGSDIDPDCIHEVCTWCREWGRQATPSDSLRRMSIGTYQIGQAMEWKDKDLTNMNESLGAAVIHTIVAAEIQGVDVQSCLLPRQKFSKLDCVGAMYVGVLKVVCTCTQLHVYRCLNKPGSIRYARASKETLGKATASFVETVFSMVIPRLRGSAIEEAADSLLNKEYLR